MDPADGNGIWIAEAWENAAAHRDSLALPAVKDAISPARPLIAGFDQHIGTRPVGGHGVDLA